MFYPFSLVKVVLKNIGFEIKEDDDGVLSFIHKTTNQEVLIGIDKELGSNYLRNKMQEINLPFDYFHHLTETVKKISDNK